MLRALFGLAVDFIAPPRRSEVLLRSLTLADLQTLGADEPLPYGDPRVQALVWELKYYANRRAAALCGAYLAEVVLAAASEEIGTPLLIPVPMHAARRFERGHNQTELLCTAIVTRLGSALAYRPDVLLRTKERPTQQGLERNKRLRNVEQTMEARNVEDRACIVIDDVVTTGATLAECRRALLAAGARSVQGIALARS